MATRKIEVAITGDSRDLERAFRRSSKSADTFGRKIGRGAGKGLMFLGGGAAAAAVAGLAATGYGLVKAGKAAAEAEASNARLAAQLKSMGKDNAAVRGQIDQTVQSLSKLGAFDDEDLQDAFTTLVRSSGNVAKSQKDLGLVADVARGAQIDLATAAKLVNRVNSGNIGSLKRYGIALEDGATKEQAIAALRQKFAGQAEAYANTAAGAQEAFAVATENALESVGVALTPMIVEFSKFAQDVLPRVAAAVSVYLGQAIAWLKTNWPQIKAVLVGVFDALKVTYTTVLIPVAKGIITAIGAVVSFVRANMPAIRSAFQSVFSWIETNIVPTVRAVAGAVQSAVATMTRIWREHGNDIKAVLGPVFNTIKTVITNALVIIREVVEMTLALIRGDWSAAFGSLKTIASTAFKSVIAIMTTLPRVMFQLASIIGREIIEGIVSGLGGLYSRVKSKLESDLKSVIDKLNPFSPVEHGGVIIATKLTDGIITGLTKNRAKVAKNLSQTVRQAVLDARGNLSSLTGGLAGMLGTIFGASSAEGKRLREIRAQQRSEEKAREKVRLQAAIDSAETDEERAQAQRDLDDWLLEQEAQSLEEAIANRQQQYETDIANLTASFNDGKISAQQFRDALSGLVGGATGAEFGYAFASEFGAQLTAVTSQIAALVGFPTGGGGPGVTSPSAVQHSEAMEKWKARKKQLEDALEDARKDAKKKDSAGGTNITPAEQRRINNAKSALDAHIAKRPKPLAMGGVLRRAVLAGEAGPEAVLPLNSGRAQRMLATALDGADRINGRSGGGTTIVVNVQGNEISARDFARRLKPELDRLVGFGQV